MILYTVGDSFTFGDELSNPKKAWPYIVGDKLGCEVHNLARNGASNDYIMLTTVNYLENNKPEYIIIGWTTENRLDIGGKSATINHDPQVFRNWNDDWASKKLKTQIITMDKYICKNYNRYHCSTWIDSCYFDNMNNYLGKMVEWCYGEEQGPYGHPLELGHQKIAENIVKQITN